jgi:outer membrane protein
MRSLLVFAMFVGVCARGAEARADPDAPYAPPAFLASPPALPPGFDQAAARRLDLTEALRIAMQGNLGITLARTQVEVAQLGVASARGAMYEPTISADYGHTGANQPPSTLQAGAPGSVVTNTNDAWSVSVNQKLPTGGAVSLGLANGRAASSSGTAVEPLTYNTSLAFNITQPLLRGFSRDLAIPQISILSAQISSETARRAFEISAAGLVQQTESAYWDLVQGLYEYDLAVKSQKAAGDTVALTRRQIDAGLLPVSNLTASESALAQHQLAVLKAEAMIDARTDALRAILGLPRDQWAQPLLPTDQPHFAPEVVTSLDDALATAVKHRPELAQAELALTLSALQLRKANNDLLPQIDLGASTTLFGQDASYGGALSQLQGRSESGWGVTLHLTWTPLNRASSVAARAARIEHAAGATAREQSLQAIWTSVRAAVRDQRDAARQVIAASRSRTLADESLAIENRKYLAGNSSNVDIAQLQNTLAQAEVAELGALLAHEKAATALLMATGRLLEQRHIQTHPAP